MTFAGESYESMEITPGTYVWAWPGESITLEILPPPAPEAIDVAINITGVLHPHHDGSPSSISGLNDVIDVVVYGSSIANGDTENFIANQIDPASLKFGPAEGGVSPVSNPVFDVDVDSDGDNDAQFEFLTGDTGLACVSNEAMLAGETNTGEAFQGMDSITTDCNAQCHN